jgi:hypothetical protein
MVYVDVRTAYLLHCDVVHPTHVEIMGGMDLDGLTYGEALDCWHVLDLPASISIPVGVVFVPCVLPEAGQYPGLEGVVVFGRGLSLHSIGIEGPDYLEGLQRSHVGIPLYLVGQLTPVDGQGREPLAVLLQDFGQMVSIFLCIAMDE